MCQRVQVPGAKPPIQAGGNLHVRVPSAHRANPTAAELVAHRLPLAGLNYRLCTYRHDKWVEKKAMHAYAPAHKHTSSSSRTHTKISTCTIRPPTAGLRYRLRKQKALNRGECSSFTLWESAYPLLFPLSSGLFAQQDDKIWVVKARTHETANTHAHRHARLHECMHTITHAITCAQAHISTCIHTNTYA